MTRSQPDKLTSSTSISASQGGQLFQIIDTENLLLAVVQGDRDGSSGRGDVLEGSGGRKRRLESSSELFDQSPRVERIKQVDVPGRSRQDWESKFSLSYELSGTWLLRSGRVYILLMGISPCSTKA
jgi:hypothetical protein